MVIARPVGTGKKKAGGPEARPAFLTIADGNSLASPQAGVAGSVAAIIRRHGL